MRKSLIVITALVVLAVLAGCNADQVANFGRGMEKMSDAGLGSKRKEPMNKAVDAVKSYLAESESYFAWPGEEIVSTSEKDLSVPFTTEDGAEQFVNTVDETVKLILAAKDSSAKNTELQKALNQRINGKTANAKTSKNIFDIVKRYSNPDDIISVIIGNFLDALKDEDGNFSAESAKTTFTGLFSSVGDKTVDTIIKIFEYNLPMPITTYEFDIIFNLLLSKAQDLLEVFNTISASSGSGDANKRSLNLQAIKQLQEDIAKSVGDRNYETVGDKLTFNIVYSLLNSLAEVNEGYKLTDAYLNSTKKYEGFMDYLLGSEKGKVLFDTVLNDLEAIAYIYGVKFDMAGLVAGMI